MRVLNSSSVVFMLVVAASITTTITASNLRPSSTSNRELREGGGSRTAACTGPTQIPTELSGTEECKQAMNLKPSFQSRTDTTMATWAEKMCGAKCAGGWDTYTRAVATQVKNCKAPPSRRMLLWSSFDDLLSGDKQQQQEEQPTEGEEEGGEEQSNTTSFPGWILGCTRDPTDNKFCASKGVDHTQGRCDFFESCCFGEYIKLTGLKPDDFELYRLRAKCPKVDQGMGKSCSH